MNWTDADNERRCDLIDREINAALSAAETRELDALQRRMRAYRQAVAPLPIDEARAVLATATGATAWAT